MRWSVRRRRKGGSEGGREGGRKWQPANQPPASPRVDSLGYSAACPSSACGLISSRYTLPAGLQPLEEPSSTSVSQCVCGGGGGGVCPSVCAAAETRRPPARPPACSSCCCCPPTLAHTLQVVHQDGLQRLHLHLLLRCVVCHAARGWAGDGSPPSTPSRLAYVLGRPCAPPRYRVSVCGARQRSPAPHFRCSQHEQRAAGVPAPCFLPLALPPRSGDAAGAVQRQGARPPSPARPPRWSTTSLCGSSTSKSAQTVGRATLWRTTRRGTSSAGCDWAVAPPPAYTRA